METLQRDHATHLSVQILQLQNIQFDKNFNGSRDHNHTPFRDDLSSVCWD